MSSNKTVVGVDMALVHLKSGGSALIARGQDVPDGLATGELDRLTDLGVFEKPVPVATIATPGPDPKVAELEAQLAAIAEQKELDDAALAKEREDAAKREAELTKQLKAVQSAKNAGTAPSPTS